MTKNDWIVKVELEAREFAKSFSPCFAAYSTQTYIKRFANARWENYKTSLEEKDIIIPTKYEATLRNRFINVFTSLIKDYIVELSKQPKNPYVDKAEKAMKKGK